jgi:hypothetical protein
MSLGVGGHNIGGRATRVEFDAAVPKGEVKASGSYENGRVLRLNPADQNAERDVVRLFDREVGIRDQNQQKGLRAVEAKLREGPIAPRPVRMTAEALQVPETRPVRGAAPSPKAKQVGYTDASGAPRLDIDAKIAATGADVIVAPSPSGFIVVRPRPAPPKTLTAPNPTSMHEALNAVVRQVSLGPPPVLNPKVAFHELQRPDVLRHSEALGQRAQATAGAGGKPPFGGDKPFMAFAEGPDPSRPFTSSLLGRERPLPKRDPAVGERVWDSVASLFAKRRQRIHSEAAGAQLQLAAKPRWSEAEIRFPANEDTLLVGLPSNPGHVHIVEVTVPVTVAAKEQSLFMRAVAWLKESPDAAKQAALNSSITRTFKHSEAIDIEEALIRYKSLMIDHGASDVRINVIREGNDIVVVELIIDNALFHG